MLKRISIYIIFVFFITSCSSTKFACQDKKACLNVEKRLEVVSEYLFYLKGDVESVVEAAQYLEKISGHKSTSGIQFDEQQPPNVEDYITWTAWYTDNYSNIDGSSN